MAEIKKCEDCQGTPCDCYKWIWGYSAKFRDLVNPTRCRSLSRSAAMKARQSAMMNHDVEAVSSVIRDTDPNPHVYDIVANVHKTECTDCKVSPCDCNERVWRYHVKYRNEPILNRCRLTRANAIELREKDLKNTYALMAITPIMRDTKEEPLVSVVKEPECADCKASPCDCNETIWGYSIRYKSPLIHHHFGLSRSSALDHRKTEFLHNRKFVTALSLVVRYTETINMVDVKPEPESLQESTPVTSDTLDEEKLAHLLAETDEELMSVVERVSDGNDGRREANLAIAVKRDEAGGLTRARAIAKRVVAVLQKRRRS
jgi:hypothetical protein